MAVALLERAEATTKARCPHGVFPAAARRVLSA